MFKLFIFNMLILLVIVLLLAVCKKYIKNEKWKNNTLLISSVVTILLHYSSFIFYLITGNINAIEYLSDNPNLILPIDALFSPGVPGTPFLIVCTLLLNK